MSGILDETTLLQLAALNAAISDPAAKRNIAAITEAKAQHDAALSTLNLQSRELQKRLDLAVAKEQENEAFKAALEKREAEISAVQKTLNEEKSRWERMRHDMDASLTKRETAVIEAEKNQKAVDVALNAEDRRITSERQELDRRRQRLGETVGKLKALLAEL